MYCNVGRTTKVIMSIDMLSEVLRDPILSLNADREARRLSSEAAAEAKEQIAALNAAAKVGSGNAQSERPRANETGETAGAK